MLMNAGLGDVIIMIIEKNLPPSLMQAETAEHVRAALIACGRPQRSVVPGPPDSNTPQAQYNWRGKAVIQALGGLPIIV